MAFAFARRFSWQGRFGFPKQLQLTAAVQYGDAQSVWQTRHNSAQSRQSSLPNSTTSEYATGSNVYDSVVKVFCTTSAPDYLQPWQRKPPYEVTGSGFLVAPGRLLTNAHVVSDSVYIQVQRHGCSRQYKARLEAVAHELDLAVLRVDEEGEGEAHTADFWTTPCPMKPLRLRGGAELQQKVVVVGYPEGGNSLSVTEGVVSRLGMTHYAHAGTALLAVQIDAAINQGNSGGPALIGDQVVGVAFQDLQGGENIGYLVPIPLLRMFLDQLEERGVYAGLSTLGLHCQPGGNNALRRALGMRQDQAGVVVNRVEVVGSCGGTLQAGDVLMAFDDNPIASDGSVFIQEGLRCSFDHLVSLKPPGSPALLTLLRGGHEVQAAVVLKAFSPLVPRTAPPQYLLYGGLLLLPLTQAYLMEFGEEGDDEWVNKCPRLLHHLMMTAQKQEEGEQVVVLAQVLAGDITLGYSQLEHSVVVSVDGQRVANMRQLAVAVRGGPGRGQWLRMELEQGRMVVLDRQQAEAALPEFMSRHAIPAAASEDLLPLLQS